jgi:hypothetical protein
MTKQQREAHILEQKAIAKLAEETAKKEREAQAAAEKAQALALKK